MSLSMVAEVVMTSSLDWMSFDPGTSCQLTATSCQVGLGLGLGTGLGLHAPVMVPGNGIPGDRPSGRANATANAKQTQSRRKANAKRETQTSRRCIAKRTRVLRTAREGGGLTDMGIPTSWQILMISMSNAQRSRWSEPNTTAAVSLVNSLKPA